MRRPVKNTSFLLFCLLNQYILILLNILWHSSSVTIKTLIFPYFRLLLILIFLTFLQFCEFFLNSLCNSLFSCRKLTISCFSWCKILIRLFNSLCFLFTLWDKLPISMKLLLFSLKWVDFCSFLEKSLMVFLGKHLILVKTLI